ncbi:MAG TPA: CoA pyrophosphatase [Beijerinckiaceae bacterium]|nr:CoA pyrophosphatase [Beijerinckiaceae bacterium]
MNVTAKTRAEPRTLPTAEIIARARQRLSLDLATDALDFSVTPRYGDHVLNQANMQAQTVASSARLAAVLVPLVEREADATVLMTTRSSELRQHSGQIAFPGGKVDEGETPCQAALRETQEEIGLNPHHVEPIGYLDPYLTGTGFRILPVVALVTPPFDLLVNTNEVHDTFEVPLAFLMQPENHQRHSREWRGTTRHFYAMPWNERYIWGATAGIVRGLYEKLHL